MHLVYALQIHIMLLFSDYKRRISKNKKQLGNSTNIINVLETSRTKIIEEAVWRKNRINNVHHSYYFLNPLQKLTNTLKPNLMT